MEISIDDSPSSLPGACLCGAVRYLISGDCSNMLNCHCSLCRKSHGAAFATFTAVRQDSLAFQQGTRHICSLAVSSHLTRSWCGICGSTLPFPEGNHYSVPAGGLMKTMRAILTGHLFTASKAPWYEITDDLRQFETFPQSMARPPTSVEHRHPDTSGSCLCGTCHFTLDEPPQVMLNCHCSRCRRSRAAAHATNVFYAPTALHWTGGEDCLVQFRLPGAERFGTTFCRDCGSLMPGIRGQRCNVPAGCLDIDPDIRPAAHIHVDDRADWFDITDNLPRYRAEITTWPP